MLAHGRTSEQGHLDRDADRGGQPDDGQGDHDRILMVCVGQRQPNFGRIRVRKVARDDTNGGGPQVVEVRERGQREQNICEHHGRQRRDAYQQREHRPVGDDGCVERLPSRPAPLADHAQQKWAADTARQ
eukprot:scaffold10870_cov117-Isochrysis_galbana.AAC.6